MEKKEAMKILKDFHDKSALFSVRTALHTIIPELRESEDEKIRKAIIKLVRQSSEVLDKQNQNNMITWLEKQKEYESTDFEYVWNRTDCGALTSALDKYSEEAIINMCHAWYDKGIELERKSWLEKQGKETSEKEFTFKALPRLLEMIEVSDRAKAYTEKLAVALDNEGYHTDAKIVRESIKIMNGEEVPMATMDEQKPQRMVSAEAKEALYDKPTDEEMKELLRTEYEKGRADTLSEMKSSWSEEDERICRNIVNDIANDKSICKYEISKRICDEQINWLKSLKQRIGG